MGPGRPLRLGRERILQLVPHTGAMCLLAGVLDFDARGIVCHADGLRELAHPLRSSGGLHALHLIEYAAQTAAVHGALTGGTRADGAATGGMLVAVRDIALRIDWLHELEEPLEITAERALAMGGGWIYRFAARCGARALADGRVTVITTATPPAPTG